MLDGLYASQGSHTSLVHATDPKSFSREEHTARDRGARGFRPPRRAQSTNDYVYPSPPPLFRGESRTLFIHQNSANSTPQTPSPPAEPCPSGETGKSLVNAVYARPPTIDEEVATNVVATGLVTPRASPVPESMETAKQVRPKLGPPRRSYSVMDYEPAPHHHRLSENLGLRDLPSELHYAIFDFLDPIDSTCLGLTSKHFYNIHRRMHGIVPLSVRRSGPNDMEWVWHLAGRMMHGGHSDAATLAATTNALAMLRVRGQALCRKCGVSRCELHKHIQDWMGPDYEYCTVREKFGPGAPEGAREFCYLSNPKDPHRCGRHRVLKSRPTTPLP